MRKHDIAGVMAIICGLAFSAGAAMAETAEPPLNPADAPSEYRKDSAVIDINLLRKRIMETPRQVNIWIDNTYGFQFIYPAHIKPERKFTADSFQNGNWSWFGEKDQGHPLVSLALPGTQQKTTIAEVRIGVSDDPDTVAQCRKLPESAAQDSLKTFRHRGTLYTFFSGGKTETNRSLVVQAYRTVHHNHCYSIELMAYGTKPDTLTPPDYGVMNPDEAMNRLTSLWRQMDFQWLPETSAKPQ